MKPFMKRVIVLVVVIIVAVVLWHARSFIITEDAEEFTYKDVIIKKADDKSKAGSLHSRLVYQWFKRPALRGGRAEDVLRIRFDSPAKVRGMWVSLDHTDQSIRLAEIMALVNNEKGYEVDTASDAIIHTSYRRGWGARKTDEHIFFPGQDGLHLTPQDYISVGGYIENQHPYKTMGVHAELIIYYEWL